MIWRARPRLTISLTLPQLALRTPAVGTTLFWLGQAALIIMSVETFSPGTSSPPPKKYVRAVGPRLRKLLYFIFALVALLGANSAYLAAVTAVEWSTGRTYQNYFYQYMFLGHLVLGLVLVVPFVVFGIAASGCREESAQPPRGTHRLRAVCRLDRRAGHGRAADAHGRVRSAATAGPQHCILAACGLSAGWPPGCIGCIGWPGRGSSGGSDWAMPAFVGAVVLGMVWFHAQDPRQWYAIGPESGVQVF